MPPSPRSRLRPPEDDHRNCHNGQEGDSSIKLLRVRRPRPRSGAAPLTPDTAPHLDRPEARTAARPASSPSPSSPPKKALRRAPVAIPSPTPGGGGSSSSAGTGDGGNGSGRRSAGNGGGSGDRSSERRNRRQSCSRSQSRSRSHSRSRSPTGRSSGAPSGRRSPQQSQAPAAREREREPEWVLAAVEAERRTGVSFVETVRGNLQFRNPAIYERMIDFCGVDEAGTHVRGRTSLTKYEFYDELSDLQEVLGRGPNPD